MPVPQHLRAVWRGTFGATEEIWSFGLNFQKVKTGEQDLGVEDFGAAALITATQGLLQTAYISSGVKCTEIRLYDIGTNGLMQGDPRYITNGASAIAEGQSTGRHPSQCALAVTMRAVNRGPARLGRFYLPGPSVPVETDWRLSTGNQAQYLTLATNFVKAAADSISNTWINADNSVINVSRTGTGAFQKVEFVSVGRVFDTIRRRRNKLEEARSESGDIDW